MVTMAEPMTKDQPMTQQDSGTGAHLCLPN